MWFGVVWIGPQGRFSVLKDCCEIADNTVVPPNTVIPPYTVYGGVPCRMVDELPECAQELFEELAKERYDNYVLQ